MHIFAIYKIEKGMGHLGLFSSLEIYGTFPMFDTIFGEKNPYPKSSVFCCTIEKILITEGEKKSWNRYEQVTCKFVEQVALLFNNNAQFSSQINNFSIKNNRTYIYYKGMFNKT